MLQSIKYAWRLWNRISLVLQILIGLILGTLLASIWPQGALAVSLLGDLFVGALKAVAPILVFILVIAAVCRPYTGRSTGIKSILILYMIGTFLASCLAVGVSFMFPTTLILPVNDASSAGPSNIVEVFHGILFKLVDNPVHALATANYLGLLSWGLALGLGLRHAKVTTRDMATDLADGVTQIVQWVIRFAPYGIFGLVAGTIAQTGFSVLLTYVQLLCVLLGCMIFTALVINPAIVYVKLRRNPYPLVFYCLRESGIPAFFTRSSAANIPVNMNLAEKLHLREQTYSVSIPIGATINMSGAAITIAVLTLAAVYTLGIRVDFLTALLLSLMATLGACGASGVAGGSLLLIPLAASLFNIDNETAMRVVAVGYTIGVLQDSTETALNSSTDILFTAAVDLAEQGQSERVSAAEINKL